MLQDNRKLNQSVSPDTAFLEELRSKLPEFFTVDKYDEAGELLEAGGFDLQKFTSMLQDRNIQELTSGYKLDFIGKDYAKKQAGERPTTVILPDKEHNAKPENRDSHNLFLTGDNLEVLRHLQASYQNAVDVIYIDPPYNTGSDGFVYPDKFEYSDESLQAMFGLSEEELKRLKSIQGRASHSAWLTFMYPRLWLAKRLLKDAGVMFVSIDDNEQANLKLLMDEIFGEGQFVGQFKWNKTSTPPSLSPKMRTKYEYIICYERNKNDRKYVGGFIEGGDAPLLNRGNTKRDILFAKESVQFNFDGFYSAGSYDRVELKTDIVIKNGKADKDFILSGEFKWTQDTVDKEVNQLGTTFIIKSNRFSIRFLREETGTKRPTDIISSENQVGTNETAKSELVELLGKDVMSYPKPTSLIKYLINFFEDKAITVLDFFAGSATTADAVMQLNAEDGGKRRYIMVQLPEPTFATNSDGTEVARSGSDTAHKAGFRSIDEISRKRIELASQKIQSKEELTDFDGGFKHYRVVSPTQQTLDDLDAIDLSDSQQLSLLEEVDFSDMVTPFSATGLGYAGSARGEETILTTWLLADGYGFDAQTEQLNLAGYQATYVDRSRLYLISSGWTSEQTKALVNRLGNHELTLQTLVIYAYSFELESLRELELALNQLDSKPELLKRY